MKKIDVGQMITILANLGVIVGIGFLAAEIRQGNALLNAESRGSRAEIRRDWYERIIENDRLVSAFRKVRGAEALTADEQLVWNSFLQYTFTGWQVAYQDWRAGLLEESDLPIGGWREFLTEEPGVIEYWDQVKALGYPADFTEWVDNHLSTP